MTDATEQALHLFFPLWGATFDSVDVGVIDYNAMVCVPDPEEWRTIQKSDVWMAQWRTEGCRGEGPTPPCCIVAIAPLGGADTIHAAIRASGAELLSSAHTAVTALRLHQPGWFLQPELAMYVFHAPSLPLNVIRAPGPYRQVFGSDPTQLPDARYALRIDDLTRDADTPGPITQTWQLLHAYQDCGGDSSVEIALESFNRSYGYKLRSPSRASNLFTALDAMLGGMSAWKIGRVPVKPRGYARRVETALRVSGIPDTDAHDAARWLHSPQDARGLRNAIAHGTGSDVDGEATQAYEPLQSIVRVLLHQYLRFSIAWAKGSAELSERLGIPGDSPLAAAYVTALETEARQSGAMLDALEGNDWIDGRNSGEDGDPRRQLQSCRTIAFSRIRP